MANLLVFLCLLIGIYYNSCYPLPALAPVVYPKQKEIKPESELRFVHDPISRNCAVSMSYTCIILPHNLNSTELHLQGVAPRSQYSDHMPEAVTLQ